MELLMKTLYKIVFFGLALFPIGADAQTKYLCRSNGDAFHELRIYEVNRSNREAFHERFQDHAMRFFKKYKFKVIDMWESDSGDKLQLIYILYWPNRATMEARWKEFRADKEWAEIRQRSVAKHGDLLLSTPASQSMVRVSYSPVCKK